MGRQGKKKDVPAETQASALLPVVLDLYSSAQALVDDLQSMVNDKKPLTRRQTDPLEALTSGEGCCFCQVFQLFLIRRVCSISVAVHD